MSTIKSIFMGNNGTLRNNLVGNKGTVKQNLLGANSLRDLFIGK